MGCIRDSIRIITYKSLTGDYSVSIATTRQHQIITYKSLTGDYSTLMIVSFSASIITYKSLTGDYSRSSNMMPFSIS